MYKKVKYFIFFYIILISTPTNSKILITAPIISDGDYNQLIDYRNSTGDNNCPSFASWPSLKPIALIYRVLSVDTIIIHHTFGVHCYNHEICSTIVKNIQNYSMGKGNCLDIKYNFLIGEDGNVYKGSDWFRPGCHTNGYDDKSISIAFIGDFIDSLPNKKAMENYKKLINCGIVNNFLDKNYKLYGGNQLDLTTKSPGLTLFNEIKLWENWHDTE